jgi:outer membrane protein TolC
MLELSVADADLADVRRQASAADSLRAKAQARLRVRFPQAAPVVTPLGEATDLVWSEAQWRERIVAEADPIKIAEGQQRKAELKAQRLRADRVADPVVGVYTASEAFRNERVFGISVSLPFGGSAREDRTLQALQEAEAARAVVERQRREIEAEVAETYADAVGHAQRGVMARRAATAAQETARLMQRAYTLGEADLQALLLARRQAVDAARAAAEARTDALKAQHRLLVDAHLIWNLEQDD